MKGDDLHVWISGNGSYRGDCAERVEQPAWWWWWWLNRVSGKGGEWNDWNSGRAYRRYSCYCSLTDCIWKGHRERKWEIWLRYSLRLLYFSVPWMTGLTADERKESERKMKKRKPGPPAERQAAFCIGGIAGNDGCFRRTDLRFLHWQKVREGAKIQESPEIVNRQALFFGTVGDAGL